MANRTWVNAGVFWVDTTLVKYQNTQSHNGQVMGPIIERETYIYNKFIWENY